MSREELRARDGAIARVKRRAKRLLGLSPSLQPEITCATNFVGSPYGGYCICPNGIGSSSVVYSAGVGDDISFDLGMIEHYGATVFAFDPTDRSIRWVKSQTLPDSFRFHEFGISDHDGTAVFIPPKNPEHASYIMADIRDAGTNGVERPVLRLKSAMQLLKHDRIDILKLDIEGAEYRVLDDLLASGVDARQILVEFHHRMPGVGVIKTIQTIQAMARNGYCLFWVSSSDEEFSFLKSAAS